MNIDFHKSECFITHETFGILRDTFEWNITENKKGVDYKWWLQDYCMTITMIRKNNNTGYRLIISGSPHKYVNCRSGLGAISHNVVKHSEILEALSSIYKKYMINLEDATLQKLEYSINIKTKLSPTKIINEMIYLYRNKSPIKNITYKNGGRGIYFKSGKMLVKVYDKGKKANLNYNLIRLEIQYTENEPIAKLGIRSTSEIFIPDFEITLAIELHKAIQLLQIIDPPISKSISDENMKLFDIFTNRKKFVSFQKETKSRATQSRRRKKFELILKENKLTTTKNSFLREIKDKIVNIETKRTGGKLVVDETKREIHIRSNCFIDSSDTKLIESPNPHS